MEYSSKDHPGKYALILYTSWCNFRCFGCHNRKLAGWNYDKDNNIKLIKVDNYYKQIQKDDLDMAIENPIIDMIILCGWEVLINNIEDIKETINYIKSKNNVPIRIDTNGSSPDKVKKLKQEWYVDWFAIDIKWPYWDKNYRQSICNIIWISEDLSVLLFPKIIESIDIAKDMEYTIYRTVRYPIIKDEKYFQEIEQYTKKYLLWKHYFSKFFDTLNLDQNKIIQTNKVYQA